MQLWINTYNLDILNNLEQILFGDDKSVAKWFMKNLPGEIYENLTPQYELQVISSMQIKKVFGGSVFKNIKGIYFGSDQCEYLLPTLTEMKMAIEKLKDFDKKYVSSETKRFVLVTPFYGNDVIRTRLIELLDYLDSNSQYINPKTGKVEIVVNDFGTIKLLKNYVNLIPVLGRLLVKTLKNPLIDTYGLEKGVHIPGEMMKNASLDDVKDIKSNIAKNQLEGIGTSSISNEYFTTFFNDYNINRFGIDYLQSFDNLYKIPHLIDIYYPYALVYVGRLCDTGAIDDIKRGYYPIDNPCPRTCSKYDISINNFDTVGYKLLLRGNASYKTQTDLNIAEEVINVYDNRLVYSPFI